MGRGGVLTKETRPQMCFILSLSLGHQPAGNTTSGLDQQITEIPQERLGQKGQGQSKTGTLKNISSFLTKNY